MDTDPFKERIAINDFRTGVEIVGDGVKRDYVVSTPGILTHPLQSEREVRLVLAAVNETRRQLAQKEEKADVAAGQSRSR